MRTPRRSRDCPPGEASLGLSTGGGLCGATLDTTGWLLAVVLVLALAARVAGILVMGGYHAPWLSEYELIAKSILENGFFGYNEEGLPAVPSSFMPPLYPFFLAGIMAVFSDSSGLAILAIQSILSASSVFLTFCLAWEILGKRSVALLSALISALYPSFIAGALEISTVTPEVLLVQLFGLFLCRWYRRRDFLHAGLAGAALGFLSLTRTPAILIAPLVSLWMLRGGGGQAHRVHAKALAVFIAAAALVIAPWTIRNYFVHQAFVPISTNGGINFWIGNNPGATGEFVHPKDVDPDLFARSLPLTEVQRDSLFYGDAFAFIGDNPQAFLELMVTKTLYFWWFRPSIGSSYPDAGQALQVARTGMMVAYTAILPLAVAGLLLLRKEQIILSLFGLIALPYMATSIIFFAATRFRSPVEPFLIIFASYTIARVAKCVGGLSPGAHFREAMSERSC